MTTRFCSTVDLLSVLPRQASRNSRTAAEYPAFSPPNSNGLQVWRRLLVGAGAVDDDLVEGPAHRPAVGARHRGLEREPVAGVGHPQGATGGPGREVGGDEDVVLARLRDLGAGERVGGRPAEQLGHHREWLGAGRQQEAVEQVAVPDGGARGVGVAVHRDVHDAAVRGDVLEGDARHRGVPEVRVDERRHRLRPGGVVLGEAADRRGAERGRVLDEERDAVLGGDGEGGLVGGRRRAQDRGVELADLEELLDLGLHALDAPRVGELGGRGAA